MRVIGHIHTDFPEKFGVPRQSNLTDTEAYIIFEPEYRQKEAFNGLEEFEYIWILFKFHLVKSDVFHATVKPPRLGGNVSKGVFATRSPFRPNNIGLSSVRLEGIEYSDRDGVILRVSGADLVDGTPVVDIKPYLPYTDSHENAKAGFTELVNDYQLEVAYSNELSEEKKSLIPDGKEDALFQVLAEDPRPGYQDDEREYGISFADINVRFVVNGKRLIITDIQKIIK